MIPVNKMTAHERFTRFKNLNPEPLSRFLSNFKRSFRPIAAVFTVALTLSVSFFVFFSIIPSQAATSPAPLVNVPSTYSITWNRTYTESNLASVDAIIQTSDGGFLLGGITPPSEGSTIELVKVDSSGNVQWNQTYKGSGQFLGTWLIKTSDGNYAIAGQYGGGFWLAEIDGNGNMLWDQTYTGSGFSWASTLIQTSDGGYALSGQTNSTLGSTNSSSIGATGDVWLLKTGSNGIEQWNETLGDGVVNSVIQTSDGGYALVGGINNLSDYLLIKTNSTGDLQWTETYSSQYEDFAYSVVQTSDGGYALGGWMWLGSNGGGLDIAIVKTDASGNTQWTKYYGSGQCWSMVQTSDGGFAMAGTSVVKVDAAGDEQWNASFGSSDTNYHACCIIQTQDGNYAVAGSAGSHAWLAKITPTESTQSSAASPTPSQTPAASAGSAPEFSSLMVIVLLVAATASLVVILKIRKDKLGS
jgi:hypothetical protein